MMFRGRTVLAFVILSMFTGSLLAMTFLNGQSARGSGSAASASAASGDVGTGKSAGGSGKPVTSTGGGLNSQEIQKIQTAYNLIENNYLQKEDGNTLVDGAIHGMMEALKDPYSVYVSKAESDRYSQYVDSYITGIGAEVAMDNGKVTVVSPIKGSPADKAGIHPKDVILSVNGQDLSGMSLNDAVNKIRGPKGSQVTLQIQRAGQSAPINLIVVRDEINVETVHGKMLPGQIGDIEISQFSMTTEKSFKNELAALEKQGMRGLIIDVRNDPGGYLTGVLNILKTLVPDGKTLIQVEDRTGAIQKSVSNGPGKAYPIEVLINGGSASASEILAAALHDSAGSKLIGEKSFGKGTVQDQYETVFKDGSLIKMTVAKWLTPDGTWINHKGLTPDIPVAEPAYFSVAPLPQDKVLKPDQVGDDVKNLQIMLAGLGLAPGRTDGYYSAQTAQAVKAFQAQKKLPVTGEVDAKTADALEAAVIRKIQDPANDAQLQQAIATMEQTLGAAAADRTAAAGTVGTEGASK